MSNATDSLAAELADAKPEPSSAAPQMLAAAGAADADASASSAAGDGAGVEQLDGFNPEIHESPPSKTVRGGWKLKRGRGSPARKILASAPPAGWVPPGAEPARPVNTTPPGHLAAATAADPLAAHRAAEDGADTVFSLAVAFLGKEYEPEPDERERCIAALERVYLKYGALDVPPGVALVLAFGMYAGRRSHLAAAMGQLVARALGQTGGDSEGVTAGLSAPGVLHAA